MQTVSIGLPSLTLLLPRTTTEAKSADEGAQISSGKFTQVDLSPHFNCSSIDFGPHARTKELSGPSAQDGLIHTPTGEQIFRGIPFQLGPEGVAKKSWIVLSTNARFPNAKSVEIPLGQRAGFACFAQFCDWDGNELPSGSEHVFEKVGQVLAEVVLLYSDGGEKAFPMRRRFEVNEPSPLWGNLSFAAVSHNAYAPTKLEDPLSAGTDWGRLQIGVNMFSHALGPDRRPLGVLWVCAVANPHPERVIKSIRMRAVSEDPIVVCGLTLFHGQKNPLRYERLRLCKVTLPESTAEEEGRWTVDVDLGVVARTYTLREFNPEAWLAASDAGLGARAKTVKNGKYVFAEVTAASEATLILRDTKAGKQYQFELERVVPGRELEARPIGARVEVLEPEKVWLHGEVVDSETKKPTPVRLTFRSKERHYIPPYGHRTEVNDSFFQDYGADVKLMDTSFAYVDGTFQVELPVGEVYVEIAKGFEYKAVRKELRIEPSQRELKLEISRHTNFRSQGWVSADTHVHYLSPSTAVLEGQAEGLNLINLLSVQMGDLFTNVGDVFQGPLSSPDKDTMVWVGTENRQHILGHISLLGGRGAPVYPMSAGGPDESYLGDPVWSSLAEWADLCRKREGLSVAAHFPYPTGEIAADIVLDKIDAVEIWPKHRWSGPFADDFFNSQRYLNWYRYLNCGFRLPAVSGTDRMGAYIPVGTTRVYAFLGQEEFSFANWARAVRRGNTFITSGPLLLFTVDGHSPGEEITLGAGGGTLEVCVEAKCFVPIHRLEVVFNERIIAAREEPAGASEINLREKIKVAGPGWLAARCASRSGPVTNWEFRICAHTSPVYVRVPGQDLFSPSAAAYMLTLIEGSQTWLETLAIRPDLDRFERVRKVLGDARALLHQRLHKHGIEH
jgi:hypothetical protein